MPYPVGITTRAVTMGGATALESAEPLILQAIIQSSRGLIWGASGWRFPSLARTVTSTAGAEITVELPVTDLPGWRLIDAEGSILDVSVPGSYTHTYTVTLIALTAANKIVSQRILGPFVLPTGDGSPVDLDTLLPVGTQAGGVVMVPDSWGPLVVAAEAAAASAQPVAGRVASQVDTDGTDQTAALQAELNALQAAGGGTLVLPAGTITIDGTLTVPGDGASPVPAMNSLTIQGQGGQVAARGVMLPKGGTVLDIKGVDTYGKLKGNVIGKLTIRDITFKDSAGTTTPFLYTTNTTLDVQGCSFIGSKTGAACDQDAIILGGPNQVEGDAAWDSGFQGYGTLIAGNFFNKIRRAVYGRAFCNSVVIAQNTIWNAGGNATGAAIELDGKPTGIGPQLLAATVVRDNLIECTNYVYGIELKNAAQCTVDGNGMWDAEAVTLAGVRLAASTQLNVVREGYTSAGHTAILDEGAVAGLPNWIYASSQGARNHLPPTSFDDINYDTEIFRAKFTGGGNMTTVQPAEASSQYIRPLRVLRSDAESVNPGAPIWAVQYDGTEINEGDTAGNREIYSGGALVTHWTNNGRTWYAPTGAVLVINPGPGGALSIEGPLRLKSYTTAGRPNVSVAGVGGAIFDTTLGKPVWSDGTNWRDASGAIA